MAIPRLIDSHCHIDGPEFDMDRDEVVDRACSAGVETMLNVGTGDPLSGNLERAVELSYKYPNILSAVGVHPHDASQYSPEVEKRLINLIEPNPPVVALGEIGLDFHYDHSPRDVQTDVFRRQLQVANELGVPVIIHSREADTETVRLLSEANLGPRPGIMHCFSGGSAMAGAAIELGFLVSFSGNVTFKNAADLRFVAAGIPLNRMLIETDSPYLSPVPFRGRRNEPARVSEVATCLAGLRNIPVEELAEITHRNFTDLFPDKI
jgi:TatD DNase family protein